MSSGAQMVDPVAWPLGSEELGKTSWLQTLTCPALKSDCSEVEAAASVTAAPTD